MKKIEKIHSKLGAAVCRRCINRNYHVKLTPEDCLYEPVPRKCSCCGDMHNIVVGFTGSGKRKMLLK